MIGGTRNSLGKFLLHTAEEAGKAFLGDGLMCLHGNKENIPSAVLGKFRGRLRGIFEPKLLIRED